VSLRQALAIGVIGGGAYLAWRTFQGDTIVTAPLAIDLSNPGNALAVGGSDIVSYLQSQGLTPGQATGVAAGIDAESLSNPNAVNPTSGAYGIGQWLGARKAALFAQYGTSPSLQDQLDFLVSELNGGDRGGPVVLAQSNPLDVLTAYITKFMRPAAGAETTGDIARGTAFIQRG
jgi:hypothetical protein